MDVETIIKSCKTKWTCQHCNKVFTAKKSLKRHIQSSCPNSPMTITLARCPSCGLTCTARNYSRHFSSCSKVWGHRRGLSVTNDPENSNSDNGSTNTRETEIKNTEITTSQTLSNSSQTTKPTEPQKKISFNATQQIPIKQWFKKSISRNNQHHSQVQINVDDTDSSDSSNDSKHDSDTQEKPVLVLRRFKKVVSTDDKPSMTENRQNKPQLKTNRSETTSSPSPKSNQTKPKFEGREIRLQGYQVLEALTNQLASLQQNAIMVFR
uniref:ZF(C2H2)-87 zinc finger protein n=1 Tax=Phallusia mammillata TaxID=59560 RepID=A0A6F9DL12_9ASCI|nr:ZF(C2H2)-87 zinc finger protein [Phallusia mammillata]